MTKQLSSRVATRTLALVSLGAVLVPGAAHATGVSAGTLIQNTASATYTSGASGGTVTSNTVSIKVDELLNVAVAGLTTTPAVAGQTSAVLEYSITNTGNGPEAFKPHVGFGVQGFNGDQVMARLTEHGVNARKNERDGVTEILVDSPDGIEIGLQDVSWCGAFAAFCFSL